MGGKGKNQPEEKEMQELQSGVHQRPTIDSSLADEEEFNSMPTPEDAHIDKIAVEVAAKALQPFMKLNDFFHEIT